MNTYKTAGIVLRSTKLREADKIVTFLTNQGKKDAVAKGVRRPKSKFGGRLEPGNDLHLVCARGRTLDTITSVHVVRLRAWIRADLGRLQAAFNFLEMADKFGEENSDDLRLLALTRAALDSLEAENDITLLRLAYDVKVLAISGFLPHLSGCVGCGGSNANWMSFADGGLICESCRGPHPSEDVEVGVPALLLELLGKKFAELGTVQASKRIIDRANDMLWAHIRYHVPAQFKTREISREKGISQ